MHQQKPYLQGSLSLALVGKVVHILQGISYLINWASHISAQYRAGAFQTPLATKSKAIADSCCPVTSPSGSESFEDSLPGAALLSC